MIQSVLYAANVAASMNQTSEKSVLGTKWEHFKLSKTFQVFENEGLEYTFRLVRFERLVW